jgi:acyl dehydratase
VAFCGVSGDFNPLHTDALFAAGTPYGERIAHGALVLSLATGLRQRTGLFDGTLLGLLEIRTWTFRAPVRIGDTIRVVNEVIELRETSSPGRGIVVQRVDVLNQLADVVQTGEFVLMVARR